MLIGHTAGCSWDVCKNISSDELVGLSSAANIPAIAFGGVPSCIAKEGHEEGCPGSALLLWHLREWGGGSRGEKMLISCPAT